MDAVREEGQERVDDERTTARVTKGQSVGAQHEHRANDLLRKDVPDPNRVAHQEVFLEPPGSCGLNERRRQIAETGGYAVHDFAVGDESLDDVARALHPRPSLVLEHDTCAAPGNRLDLLDREVAAGQHYGSHGARIGPRRLRYPSAPCSPLSTAWSSPSSTACMALLATSV